LREIASRLKASFRETDILARLGGDEAAGRNGYCFFDPEMSMAASARHALENELRRAVQLNCTINQSSIPRRFWSVVPKH
jgi:PleD family two-component response regulator